MEKVDLPEETLERPEVKAILENYTSIMLHKDLVEKISQYSMLKGRENWEEEFEKLLDRELAGSEPKAESQPESRGENKKSFKL